MEDGMLCVDLAEAGTVITGNRTKTSPLTEAAEPAEDIDAAAVQEDPVGDDTTDDS
ncbi:hypothetical protein [Kocuria sabuli]|uniref:hypothetical protein n=1 Tax=Kocuria sabuli TaxID=3071448 RepID=UPI0034D69C9F